ncbi:7TM GPCR domain containing protein, partial [Trichostrongylus colubriformis]
PLDKMGESTMTYIRWCVVSEILFFNIVGVFGNVQLLWTTYRKNATHSKPAVVILLTAIDLLFALLFPIRYRLFPTKPYVVAFILIGSCYASTFAVWGWIARDDDVIPFCNPPLGLAPHVSRMWSSTNVIINSMVVLVYGVIITLVHVKGVSSAYQENRRVLRRLKVIVIIFVCSWYIALLGVNFGYVLGFSPDALAIWQSNMVLFALVCYSQTFYVCIWRSPEYLTAFKEQLCIMMCKKQKRQRREMTRTTTTRIRPQIVLALDSK